MNKWNNVLTSLPLEYGDFITYNPPGYPKVLILNYDLNDGIWENDDATKFTPSHWMNMPDDPKDGE
jgi:hypothetical protein